MATMRFTKTHEREEGRRLKTGFVHSWIGLLLCWLPIVGLLFSASGYVRVMVRLTKRHRRKRGAYLAFSFLVLVLCTGVLLGEVYVYSRDPGILQRTGRQVWALIVGEEESDPDGAFGYPDEGDWYADGFADLDDGFDWDALETDDWGFDGAEWIADESQPNVPKGATLMDGEPENPGVPAEGDLANPDAAGLNIGSGAGIIPPIK